MKGFKKNISLIGLIFILVIIFRKANLTEFKNMLHLINIETYVFLSILQLITLSMTAFIWFYLIKANCKKIDFFTVFRINSAAGFIESITPSSKLGGEAAKIYLLKKVSKLTVSKITSLVLVKSLSTFSPFLLILVITVSISFFLFNIPTQVYTSLGLILGGILSIMIFLRFYLDALTLKVKKNSRVNKYLHTLKEIFQDTSKIASKKDFSILLSISSAEWLIYPLKVYIISRMIGMDVNLILVSLATFSAYCVSIIPLTPGGLGTFESTMALVLSLNGVPFETGLFLAVSTRVITFWLPLVISFFSWISLYISKNKVFVKTELQLQG